MQIIEQLAARLFGPELAFIAVLAAVLFGTAKAAQYIKRKNSAPTPHDKVESEGGKS